MTGADAPERRGGLAGLLERFSPDKAALAAGLIGLMAGGGAVAVATGQLDRGPADRAGVEAIVRDYILNHPEILPEAMERLQARTAAQAVSAHRAQLEAPFAGAWAGAENGDVVLVEFFDFACPYCRKSNLDVERLLREDDKLKVVWRDWPVLGPDSEIAAQVSLAAAKQGQFRKFHDHLFALGRPTAATIAQAQQAVGISDGQLAELRGSGAARAELAKNYELARAVNATGTPTFVIGDQVLQGAVGYEALKAAIADARAKA